ncbi:phage tail assembly chaperone [Neorhizobium sp. LjRoot104]|uniref:phage tail assembly chaperone n=1 Tax=Neorhizobium sp. LjRoot104 TaxID=3342254 RepID=UPI003ED0D002
MAEAKIKGMEIKVDRPLATEALKLHARLMKAAGGLAEKLPSILASRRPGVSEEDKAKAEAEALTAITGIFNSVSPDEYARLVGDIVGLAKIKGPSGQYDQADLDGDFSANLGAIIPVAVFVLKEVFGDFFSGALASGSRGTTAKG